MKNFLFVLLLLIAAKAQAAEYHIGPGQTYTTIGALDWASLAGGDHIYIHYGTYNEMIWLSTIASEESPLIIEGVPDASGNLPVLDGDDMVMPSSYDGHLSEYDLGGGKLAQGYGMVFVHWSSTSYGSTPKWITVKNLELKNTNPESYTFTNTNGAVQSYPDGSAGVYVKTGENITLENIVIHNVGNGIESQGVDAMVKDLIIRSCHVYDYGRTDGRVYLEHGIYSESSGLIVENSIIGPAISGTQNSTIKSRGADTVIRYNLLYSGARLLDLVEPENQSSYDCDGTGYRAGGMHDEPGFDESWVYGNVMVNRPDGTRPYSAYPIHYGYDNCPPNGRGGTLYFYNNTVIHDVDSGELYSSEIFDLTPEGTISLYNNAILSTGTTILSMARHSKSTSIGELVWNGGNWITSGYAQFKSGHTGTWTENVTPLSGSNSGVLTDSSTNDASIPPGSPLISSAVSLPSVITTAHNVTRQYASPVSSEIRTRLTDIGAFMYGDQHMAQLGSGTATLTTGTGTIQ